MVISPSARVHGGLEGVPDVLRHGSNAVSVLQNDLGEEGLRHHKPLPALLRLQDAACSFVL